MKFKPGDVVVVVKLTRNMHEGFFGSVAIIEKKPEMLNSRWDYWLADGDEAGIGFVADEDQLELLQKA